MTLSDTIDQLDHLPTALAEIPLARLTDILPRPTLIHLAGEREPPLFLSTLLHGNETTSFEVLQHLTRRYAARRPPRGLMILVGNVEAARRGLRHLPGAADFNRIWTPGDTPAHKMTAAITAEARRRGVVASIDIHNNTGRNPIYGCVNALRAADLHLAAQFSPTGVYYLNPATTQSVAFSHFCPAITLECGQSGDKEGLGAALGLVDHVMMLENWPQQPPARAALHLYETVGRVVVAEGASLAWGDGEADLVLRADLEDCNFQPLVAGAPFARVRGAALPLRVEDEFGHDLTARFLRRVGDNLVLASDVYPAMVTPEETIIREDCLCYLMQPIAW